MLRFNVVKGEVVLDINSLGLRAFRDIYEYDSSAKKRKAQNMLYFCYLMGDLRLSNPVRDMGDRKEEEARGEAFGKSNYRLDSKGEKLLDLGIEAYEKHSQTSEERMLEMFDSKIDEQREIMSRLKGVEVGSDGVTVKHSLHNEVRDILNAEGIDPDKMVKILDALDILAKDKPNLNKEYSDVLEGVLNNLKKLLSEKETLKKIVLETGSGKIRGGKERSHAENGSFIKIKSKTGK